MIGHFLPPEYGSVGPSSSRYFRSPSSFPFDARYWCPRNTTCSPFCQATPGDSFPLNLRASIFPFLLEISNSLLKSLQHSFRSKQVFISVTPVMALFPQAVHWTVVIVACLLHFTASFARGQAVVGRSLSTEGNLAQHHVSSTSDMDASSSLLPEAATSTCDPSTQDQHVNTITSWLIFGPPFFNVSTTTISPNGPVPGSHLTSPSDDETPKTTLGEPPSSSIPGNAFPSQSATSAPASSNTDVRPKETLAPGIHSNSHETSSAWQPATLPSSRSVIHSETSPNTNTGATETTATDSNTPLNTSPSVPSETVIESGGCSSPDAERTTISLSNTGRVSSLSPPRASSSVHGVASLSAFPDSTARKLCSSTVETTDGIPSSALEV